MCFIGHDELPVSAVVEERAIVGASGEVASITILTEGYNTLHLKKWASLFFPGKVAIVEGLQGMTNKNQLLAYGKLLDKMDVNPHFLIVWDCDAESEVKELSKGLSDSSKVTAFSLQEAE